jgi:hypothetical protein
MTLLFDTSGYVDWRGVQPFAHLNHVAWSDLSPFEQGYVEAMLSGAVLATTAQLVSRGRDADFKRFGFSDLDPSALAMIMEDCARFRSGLGKTWIDRPDSGAEFWSRRQKRYWPGRFGYREIMAFPALTVFLNDAGKVCLRPTSAPDAPPLHPAQIKGESR